MENKPYTIGVIGLWHLGETFAAGLAELGHTIIAYDQSTQTIENLKKGIIPIAEPQIAELIAKAAKNKTISFTNNPADLAPVDVLWITFDTPVNDEDAADMTPIFDALKAIAPHLKQATHLVITSQIAIGTSRELKNFMNQLRPDLPLAVAYTPENLQLGRAADAFFNPVRIVIGAETPQTGKFVESLFSGISAEFLHMGLESAETAKHALNAFLATSISFINDIADICDAFGADVADVTKALKSDPRIGPKAFLSAGMGFAGGTLGRDLYTLLDKARAKNIRLPVIEAARAKNRERIHVVSQRLEATIGTLSGKRIAILGLTYKPGTPTLRRSLALDAVADLTKAGAIVTTHDPMADAVELDSLGIAHAADPYAASVDANAIVVMTDWPQFLEIDFQKLADAASPGALLYDTKNALREKKDALQSAGLQYKGTGR